MLIKACCIVIDILISELTACIRKVLVDEETKEVLEEKEGL
jgi:hypothetical protein